LNVNGQEDTAAVKKYIVKKKSRQTDGGGTTYFLPPGDGCTINGSSTVAGGSTTTHFLICDVATMADYWEVICGTAINWFGDEIDIQWNSSGCTSGIIKARKLDGTILATKTVTITAPPPPTITYTPLFTSSTFTKTIDLTKPVGTVASSAGPYFFRRRYLFHSNLYTARN
jgi:hypothetical protein